MKKTYLHIYYGDGKGKTTAAVGLCLRAHGAGKRILFAQFLKNGSSHENGPLKQLGVHFLAMPAQTKFYYEMSAPEQQHYKRGQQALLAEVLVAIQTQPYDVVVLDEALDALSLGILTPQFVHELLGDVAHGFDLILTGREPGALLVQADYATHMQNIAHPYANGTPARLGIEY